METVTYVMCAYVFHVIESHLFVIVVICTRACRTEGEQASEKDSVAIQETVKMKLIEFQKYVWNK